MYTAPRLTQLLAQQHQQRSPDLFKQGIFTLQWRGKIGSFPYPDLETIVSAGEPCGYWNWNPHQDFGNLDQRRPKLPLNGYIAASAIRGIVRAWAKNRKHLRDRMYELLGEQDDDDIVVAGKIQFLDAWPKLPAQLSLDIVNPQQQFQVFHDSNEQGKPLPCYTLGDGRHPLEFTVAIRGIPDRATAADVQEVWDWVQQALNLYGIGGRTASGYGAVKVPRSFQATPELRQPDQGYSTRLFEFTLFSQGCYGADTTKPELRPSHWRGWLRSWMLRFFLGVMSQADAELTVGELLGTLEAPNDRKSRKGVIRLQMVKNSTWEKHSSNNPTFYVWQGSLKITAPTDMFDEIILPIIKFAAMTGGVGRGWRRPLHIFMMTTKDSRQRPAQRGTHLILKQKVRNSSSGEVRSQLCRIPLNAEAWLKTYNAWKVAVISRWANRVITVNQQHQAEVFSPEACSVYIVPAPEQEPIDLENYSWRYRNASDTRGDGMELIYQKKYKRKIDVGGDAARGNAKSHCSWVSIKRVDEPHLEEQTDCQEVVCVFMGQRNQLRLDFLRDLHQLTGSTRLFGCAPEP